MIILREQKKESDIKSRTFSHLPKYSGKSKEAAIGFAVDIGTTTVALYLVDLSAGKILAAVSETNEQTKLGTDVMMRIMHAISGKSQALHQMIIGQIERMSEQVLSDFGMQTSVRRETVRFCVAGNTAMCHFFLGRDVSGLSGYPFLPAYTGSVVCTGIEIDMASFSASTVVVLPGIAAHVGSDTSAVIGAEELYRTERVQLAVDLGTNAEIVLNRKGEISVCSASAGPAFEGKGITCGMPAKKSAIHGMRILKNGNFVLELIGGGTPAGICGSGLVDAVSQLKQCGVLQENGYLFREREAKEAGVSAEIDKQLVSRKGENAVLLYSPPGKGKEVYLTQSDIRNIQLAKAAIQAGMQCLLKKHGMTLEEVDELVVAGTLGSSLSWQDAVSIGLLPDFPKQNIRFAGNAAGKGAVLALLEPAFLGELEEKVKRIRHMELAQEEQFQKLLVRAMDFRPWT